MKKTWVCLGVCAPRANNNRPFKKRAHPKNGTFHGDILVVSNGVEENGASVYGEIGPALVRSFTSIQNPFRHFSASRDRSAAISHAAQDANRRREDSESEERLPRLSTTTPKRTRRG